MIQLGNQKNNHIILKLDEKIVLYLCGPTVYDHVHIGNLRGVFVFDLLIRLLKEQEYNFVYYQNITDIDDKIVARAKEKNQDEKQLTDYYFEAYYHILKETNVLLPQFLKVTDFMPDIIYFIKQLLKKNVAYIRPSGVYFDTQKTQYFHPSAAQTSSVAKTNQAHLDKKHFHDFALWKNDTPGKKWITPWGQGRPGWHTECAALIDSVAGTHLNVHGGGKDLAFPHHFNEQIQFEILHSPKHLTDFWLTNGFVSFRSNKISKSVANNFNLFLTKDFLKKYSANVLRFLFYFSSYVDNVDITKDLLSYACQLEKKIKKNLIKIRFQLFLYNKNTSFDTLIKFDSTLWNQFLGFLNLDLNTIKAIGLLKKVMKQINLFLLNKDYVKTLIFTKTLLNFLDILGIKVDLSPWNSETIMQIDQWQQALKLKNYLKADLIRDILQKNGVLI